MKEQAFNIYKYEFICDVCQDSTCMGLIGYSDKYHKICDLCLVDDLETQEQNNPSSFDDTSALND